MISVGLIVRDEEELLPICLAAAAPAADELVVVDTGSTDATPRIAADFGARVLHVPWRDSFAEARNAALDAVRGDWVLFLDADEELASGGAEAVRALTDEPDAEAYALAMTSLTGDGSTSATHPALRLWRHRPDRRFEGRVHERLIGLDPAAIRPADVGILHRGYLDLRWAERDKTGRNLRLLAREPPTPFTAFNLGSEYARAGDWERAAICLDAAWNAAGDGWSELDFGPLLAGRTARARREVNRVGDARALLAQAIARFPDYTDLTYELALCATADGRPADAARLLRRCLALGDAPAPYLATAGAGSHLARAQLDNLLLNQVRASLPSEG